MNVLIRLHKGYGLGDAVQMSAVLRHVAKYRPEWEVWYEDEHGVGRGLVAHLGREDVRYDAEVLICLYDTWADWGDRPNTRVSSCLHEHFGLPWDPECGRYEVRVPETVKNRARYFLNSRDGDRFIAVHYQGDSDRARKDLTNQQTLEVCESIKGLGRIPLLLDWRNQSPLSDSRMLGIATTGNRIACQGWGSDAEMNCAIISRCEAFVGIDSGPGKCASATDTPALIVWTGHHPAPFHDPAPNTTHLVPAGYHGLEPVCNDAGVIAWFEANYNVRQYDSDPVHEINRWLTEVVS